MNLYRQNDVAIYCSKLSKCEISLEEQIRRLKRYCKHFDLNIVKEYIETDNVNKPVFNQMVKDIDTREFNIVLSHSFDTLAKNDSDLYNLVYKLNDYCYELQLENSYIYKPVDRHLFKMPRDDEAEMERYNAPKFKKKATCYPIFDIKTVKNPMSDKPYNWLDLLSDERTTFEEEPIFDENGNYLGIHRDAYVVFKEIKGYGRIKSKKINTEEKEHRKLKPRKLFETSSDIEENKEGKNEL